ncbi:hypothetical protein TEK04_15515 [Klenkia sp. LSe6-5]|uniref:Uncharacterized protein n=1 Tax=Klenkia sesuvii TaxID=3103137 RepID=A0ABU8DWD8_9ACTN
MDVETLLRDSLSHQAEDAPRAGDDFFDRAVQARSARRRHLAGSVGVAVVVSALVVGLTVVSRQQGTDAAMSASDADARPIGGTATAPVEVMPAPPVAQQQAQLARDLGISDPPAVDVVRLVTPIQRERLVADCMTARGWDEGFAQETTTVDVTTGFLSTRGIVNGPGYPADEQERHDRDTYTCMASYPIDPAYVEDSGDPYVDSPVVEAAGPGQQLAGYDERAVLLDEDGRVRAAWVGNDFLALTTWGSGSCPEVPVSWTVEDGALTVTTGPLRPDAEVCTEDYGPFTVVLEVPRGIDPGRDLALTVDGRALSLPAAR